MTRSGGSGSFRVIAGLVLSATLAFACGTVAGAAPRGTQSTVPSTERTGLLRAICEGAVRSASCSRCPAYAGELELEPIGVGPYHLGSFVQPGAREAYVALTGCDTKPSNFGGGVLLRRSASGTWRVLRYDSGTAPNTCRRFRYETGTALLVCLGGGSGQGFSIDSVGALYMGPSKTTYKSVLAVQSNIAACQPNLDVMTMLDWRAADLDGDNATDLELTVRESHAVRPAGADDCDDSVRGRVVTHRLGFRFDGVRFTPTARSAALVACLQSDALGEGIPASYCA